MIERQVDPGMMEGEEGPSPFGSSQLIPTGPQQVSAG